MKPTMVSYPMSLRLLSSLTGARPLPAEFSYTGGDPLAVTVIFEPDSDAQVTWVFARDLLTEGLTQHAGSGDVSVWPVMDGDGRRCVKIRLSSPDGDAFLLADAAHVEDFLAQTWAVVPPGSEGQLLNIDGVLDTLLDGA